MAIVKGAHGVLAMLVLGTSIGKGKEKEVARFGWVLVFSTWGGSEYKRPESAGPGRTSYILWRNIHTFQTFRSPYAM